MSLELASHPEWECREFRAELADQLRKLMGVDAPRLKSLDVAHYVPPTLAASIDLERSGMPQGGIVQIAGYVCRIGDGDSGQAFRCAVPRLMKWRDIPKIAQNLVQTIVKSLGRMDREVA